MSFVTDPQYKKVPHILVVDDERGILDMVALCLRQTGYIIKTAYSAEAALNLIEVEQFSAIVTDVMMPGEDGISLLGKVHAKSPDTPVILMTGYAQLQMAVNAIKNGAFDFIHKPFDFSYLRAVVEKAVRYSSLIQHEKEYKENLIKTVEERTADLTTALQKLDVAHKELLAASNEKSVFMATISHEMRTPMNGVIGGLDLLENTDLTGNQSTYLALTRQAAKNMLELVERMLAFSDMAGRVNVTNSNSFELAAVMKSIDCNHRARLTKKGLSFTLTITPSNISYISCHEEQLIRLIDILLDNACKFTNTGSVQLDVAIEQGETSAATLLLTVTDSGIGIPSDKLNKIFEPFTQVDGSSTRRFGGVGLGLGIAKSIVTMLRGEITVKSIPNDGSCFCCKIPCEIVLNGEQP